MRTAAGVPITSSVLPYRPGDWFAIPLRFGLFAVGRIAAVDERGTIVGYFFGRFFERLPAGSDVLGLTPGDADLIGVCDQQGLSSGEWPLVTSDPRPWTVPVFRTIEPASSIMRWRTVDPADLTRAVESEREPADAGARNWGLAMTALEPAPMSPAAVEFVLWRCFRTFQNAMHRKYLAAMERAGGRPALSRR